MLPPWLLSLSYRAITCIFHQVIALGTKSWLSLPPIAHSKLNYWGKLFNRPLVHNAAHSSYLIQLQRLTTHWRWWISPLLYHSRVSLSFFSSGFTANVFHLVESHFLVPRNRYHHTALSVAPKVSPSHHFGSSHYMGFHHYSGSFDSSGLLDSGCLDYTYW